jgi:hypothetical protein
VFHCNCIEVVDVVHPIPQATAAGHSSGAHRRGKGPLEIVWSLDVFAQESNEGTDMDAYLNMAIFLTQPVRWCVTKFTKLSTFQRT